MNRIIESILPDLQEFLNLDNSQMQVELDTCRQRSKDHWIAVRPKTYLEANRFYQNAPYCPAQYTAWTLRDSTVQSWPEMLTDMYFEHRWGSVLDYGAGLSTHPLVMADNNCLGIVAADFMCPVFSFGQMRAWKYDISVEFVYFHPALEVQPVFKTFSCIIAIHVVGHSFNPFGLLAELATHGEYLFWCHDFRTTELPDDNLYPMHRLKPDGWDDIFSRTFDRVDGWLYKSKLAGTGCNAKDVAREWIQEAGWSHDAND